MSEIVAIITEYNPFHNGHKYQIDKIREQIKDATIIAIMSGNCVQRGDLAFINKYNRAQIAVECGVDAVFELPFPYSCSTAEIFAGAGVEIASKLGADYLFFGIESDSLEQIEKIAFAIDTIEFDSELQKLKQDGFLSYPVLREKALSNLGLKMSNSSNDILAIEYIRAIKNKGLDLKYRAIKRKGACYKNLEICDVMSASAIRESFYRNGNILSMPNKATDILNDMFENGAINDRNATNRFLLNSILLKNPVDIENIFDVTDGMGYYIYESAKKCKNPNRFTDDLSSKSFTTSRLKRAILYAILNLNSFDKSPKYTTLLAVNDKGKALIKQNRKKENIVILTKHSDASKLDEKSKMQLEKSLKLDEIYETLYMLPSAPANAYKKKPYIK
ncbi:MAG: nucleotidyltransferase family protein [Clostridia bacterium]|nr:nucleotidyltransferase family protein [Clostridia bacterium]